MSLLGSEEIGGAVPDVNYPRSALTLEELRLLSYLTEHLYSGQGALCDLGCGKGGTTFALCDGLSRNPKIERGKGLVHAYDWMEFSTGPHSDGDTATFWKNLAPFRNMVTLHIGDLRDETWEHGDIEVLFIDVAKEVDLFSHVVCEFFPALLPGVSLIVHQDFGRPRLPWLHYSTGLLLPYLEILALVEDSLVVKVVEPIPEDLRRAIAEDDFSVETRISQVRRMRSMLGAEKTRGYSYHEVLGLSEAFVHFYAGNYRQARQVVEQLDASRVFVERFQPMMRPILESRPNVEP